MIKTFLTIASFVLLFCGGNVAKNLRDKAARKDLPATDNAKWTAGIAPKYAYVLITYSKQEHIPEEKINRPYGPPDIIASHYRTVKKQWVSPIEEFETFGEMGRQRLLDKVENAFHFTYRDLPVINRQCFDFRSYSEASKDIEYRKSEDVEEYIFGITDGS
jgi:hypothetical protein